MKKHILGHFFCTLTIFLYFCPLKTTSPLLEKEFNKLELAKSIAMLWDPLADEQRELLIENISVRHLERDEVLYKSGSTPTHFYYLLSGKICLRRKGVVGQHQIIRMVEPGAIFGYVAAIEGHDYLSTAIAGDKTSLVQIPTSLMFHFIWENSDFAMLFIKELSSLLGISVEHTMNLTQKHIRGRLAETLLTMRDKYGVEEDGRTLAVYLSREDLAQMSNMTTSNAIRTLSAFAKEGLIIIEGRKIKFVDSDELKVISDRG
jgi:CRP-like cAMP-binding protein